MDRESLDRLRFDRRLQSRRGWVAPDALEDHLERLPDVSDKMTTLGAPDEGAAAAGEGGAGPSAAGSTGGATRG